MDFAGVRLRRVSSEQRFVVSSDVLKTSAASEPRDNITEPVEFGVKMTVRFHTRGGKCGQLTGFCNGPVRYKNSLVIEAVSSEQTAHLLLVNGRISWHTPVRGGLYYTPAVPLNVTSPLKSGELSVCVRGKAELASFRLSSDQGQAYVTDQAKCYVSGLLEVFALVPTMQVPAALGLGSLREQAYLCDVVLRAAGKDFPVHRVAMASASPVFRAMFNEYFAEAKQAVVVIDAVPSVESFQLFLDFLYTGTIDDPACNHTLVEVELLELADRFLVDSLKETCVSRLLQVNPTNVLAVLRFAHERSVVPEAVLVKATGVFFANLNALVKTQDWLSFVSDHGAVARSLLASHSASAVEKTVSA